MSGTNPNRSHQHSTAGEGPQHAPRDPIERVKNTVNGYDYPSSDTLSDSSPSTIGFSSPSTMAATPTPSTNTPSKTLPVFSSPAPRSIPGMGINFDSPAALGLSLEGGVGMGISMSGMSMSQLGLTASAIGRADDEERRRRLESVIAILSARPGRVSLEGIKELCRKADVQVMEEVEPSKTTLFIMIGNDAMVEIPFRNGEVESTSLSLANEPSDIKFAETGSKILLRDLRPLPGQSRINLTLERFSANLDKLIRMDKLSAEGVNCFHAIFGVYTSLRKLFDHEKKMAMALYGANTPNASIKAEREVLCKKSGRPRINTNNFLGLSLEYWMDHRHIIPKKPRSELSEKASGKMAVDSVDGSDTTEDDPETNKIYSLLIDVESSPSSLYQPIRVSNEWIAPEIEKPADADPDSILFSRSNLAWRDPEPTYIPTTNSGSGDAMDLESQPGRLPNIRFIAKFNPPIVVPLSVAVTIHQSVSNEIPNEAIRPTTFTGLALRPGETDPGSTGLGGESTQELQSETTVLVVNKDGLKQNRKHTNSLYIPKTEWARAIETLPFHHPRQLIDILPLLRQYAFLTSLLQDTFGPSRVPSPPDPSMPAPDTKDPTLPSLQIDLNLTYAQPNPRFSIYIPHPRSTRLSDPSNPLSAILATPQSQDPTSMTSDSEFLGSAHPPITLTVDVLHNADLVVSEQNVVDVGVGELVTKGLLGGGEVDEEKRRKIQRFGVALDRCGDLGVWAEWVVREVEKGEAS